MHCNYLKDENGKFIAIVCGGRNLVPVCPCGKPSRFQCDWKTGPGKTCDKHLCAKCAKEVAPEKHLCPAHQVAYVQWRAARAPRPSLSTPSP